MASSRCLGFCAAVVLTIGWSVGSASAELGPLHSASSGQESNRSAQNDLEAALKAAKQQYRQLHNFSQAAPPALEQYDAKLTWLAPDVVVVPSGRQVGVSNGGDNANQTVTLAAVSASGTCWYLVDVGRSGSETLTAGLGIRSTGLWYGHQNHAILTCNAPNNGPPPGSSLTGGWNHDHF